MSVCFHRLAAPGQLVLFAMGGTAYLALEIAWRGTTHWTVSYTHLSLPEKGVTVSQQEGRLVITLHIKVGYGLNIASITQSITHRVKDEVEHATGLKVARIDVFVDDIIDE